MELNNNIYGFLNNGIVLNTNGTIDSDSNNFDTHALKSLEYGALAILSQSQYGKNSEISSYYTNGSPYISSYVFINSFVFLNLRNNGHS